MAQVNLVEKTKHDMNLFGIIKFQLISHCFFNKISLNDTEFNCLALLGVLGEIRLIDFCRKAVDAGFLGSATAVNNSIARVEKSKLFLKKGAGKKMIFLNPELKIQTKGNILINYKLLRIEANDNIGTDQEDSRRITTS